MNSTPHPEKSRRDQNRLGPQRHEVPRHQQGLLRLLRFDRAHRRGGAGRRRRAHFAQTRQVEREHAVDAAVREAVTAASATTVKDMGGVMAALKAKYAGQMDFAKASAAVKKALTG